jgi:hypothetical protein
VKNPLLRALSCGGLIMALGGCNVGSDENQLPTASANGQTTTSTPQLLKPAVQPVSTDPATPETYYLLLYGVNAAGERVSHAIEFQRQIQLNENPGVELIWFEPNRKADGGCLQDLSGYELEYGQQRDSYTTSLSFDLASRDMSVRQ